MAKAALGKVLYGGSLGVSGFPRRDSLNVIKQVAHLIWKSWAMAIAIAKYDKTSELEWRQRVSKRLWMPKRMLWDVFSGLKESNKCKLI